MTTTNHDLRPSSFQVSVIVPVYNAGNFLVKSVESAISLEHVSEIILIEDGSSDGSFEVCQRLATAHPKVRLLQHANGANRGAGASRNLGISMATMPYVAFLDADDFFLPHRFEETKIIFESNPTIAGVYEPINTIYYDEKAKRDFCQLKGISAEQADTYLTYTKKNLTGRDFFYALILETNLSPSTDGITVKRSLFKEAGLFNETLRLHQDSEMWIRLSFHGDFKGTDSKKPVATRGVHASNRITKRNYDSMFLYHDAVYNWAKAKSMPRSILGFLKHKRSFALKNKTRGYETKTDYYALKLRAAIARILNT